MSLSKAVSPHFTADSASAAVAGGAVLGLVILTKLHANGNVLGISGIIGGLTKKAAFQAKDFGERVFFTLGMLGGGYILATFVPTSLGRPMMELAQLQAKDLARLLFAGLLVGYGTARGSGCTSGHGICGNSRLSPRSAAATGSFMLAGAVGATLGQTSSWLKTVSQNASTMNIISWPTLPSTSFIIASSLAFTFGSLIHVVLSLLSHDHYPTEKEASKSYKNELARMLVDGLSGLTFALALGLAGMTSQQRVADFLDLSSGLSQWDPTLGLVMGGALGLTTPLIHTWVEGLHLLPTGKPRTCDAFKLPDLVNGKGIDYELLTGSFMFGLGWGIVGLCPGPSMISLGGHLFSNGILGHTQPYLLFNGAMITGWALHHRSVEVSQSSSDKKK